MGSRRHASAFDLHGLGWEDAEVAELLEVLPLFGRLSNLDLSGNTIGAEVARLLADALSDNGSLTSLDMLGNEMGPEGAKALAPAIAANGSLTTLNLAENQLCGLDPWTGEGTYTGEGITAIADALRVNGSTTEPRGRLCARRGSARALASGRSSPASRTLIW
jgi:hypothetical protein